MSKKTAKLLHISSQSEQENQQNNKAELRTSDKKNSLKYSTHKSESTQLQKNMLFSDHNDQDYFKDEALCRTEVKRKKKPIKFIDEQFFNVEDHTIAEQKSQNLSKTNMSILEDLKNIKKNNNQKYSSTNPQIDEVPKTARRKRNILQADFDTDSENENNENIPKVKAEQSEVENVSSKNEEEGIIKEVEWDYKTPQEQFIVKKVKETQRLHLVLQRQKSGVNFFLPQFNLLFSNDIRYVLSCKKQLATNFQCVISLDHKSFSEDSPAFVGKIVGNFKNTVYNLVDKGKNILCTTKFKTQNTHIVAPHLYEIYILNENCSYFDLIGYEDGNCEKGLDELYRVPVNRQYISFFRNKKPEYCEKLGAFLLNFSGRVTEGSVKNFLVEDSKSGRQILMFGKGSNKQAFNLYISAPLNPLLALGIVIPHFTSRILVK